MLNSSGKKVLGSKRPCKWCYTMDSVHEQYECFFFSQNLIEMEDNNKSFLTSVLDTVLKNISQTKKVLEKDKKILNVLIKKNEISATNMKMLDEIKALKPWVIIWSNLCDYFIKDEFIFMAKYVSSIDTIHSGHTMNWVQSVFGVEISDYPIETRKNLHEKMKGKCEEINKLAYYNLLKRLNPKFVTNIRNKFTYFFSMRFFDNWMKFYFQETKWDKVMLPITHNLSQNQNTYYYLFTFNEKINFKNLTEI